MISARISLTILLMTIIPAISFASHVRRTSSILTGDLENKYTDLERRVKTYTQIHKDRETEPLRILAFDVSSFPDHERAVKLMLLLSKAFVEYNHPYYFEIILFNLWHFTTLYQWGLLAKNDTLLEMLQICRDNEQKIAFCFADLEEHLEDNLRDFDVDDEEAPEPAKRRLSTPVKKMREEDRAKNPDEDIEYEEEELDPKSISALPKPTIMRIKIDNRLATSLPDFFKYIEAILKKQPNLKGAKDQEALKVRLEEERLETLTRELEKERQDLERLKKTIAADRDVQQSEQERIDQESHALEKRRKELAASQAALKVDEEAHLKAQAALAAAKASSGTGATPVIGKPTAQTEKPKPQDPVKPARVSWAKKLTAVTLITTVVGLAALELLGSNPSKKLQRGTDYLSSLLASK